MNVNLPINILGVMSGTSLDGLDLALCQFKRTNGRITFKILKSTTYQYSKKWKNRLKNIHKASAFDFCSTDISFGQLIGEFIETFRGTLKIDLIASHGHTVFHEPQLGFSTQIGNGNTISAVTNLPVICDFRQLDIQYGGTGAPLVPIGDRDLFSNKICVNLGGICNISYLSKNKMIAYDLMPFNIPMNHIAEKVGYSFDKNGAMAQSGTLIPLLLKELNQVEYYDLTPPKSLDKTWIEGTYFPILSDYLEKFPPSDVLHTLVQHAVYQITNKLKEIETDNPNRELLITGGGSYNCYFVDELKKKIRIKIAATTDQIIEFKEALLFAYLGLLNLEGKPNCLSAVTGALKDSCTGVSISRTSNF